MYRRCVLLSVAVATLVVIGSVPAVAQDNTLTGVTVNGTAQAKGKPDLALLSFSVETRDSDATKAAQANANQTTRVIDALLKFPVPRKDIETTGYSLHPVEEYRQTGGVNTPVIVGYQVMNTVQVRLRDLTKVGVLIDTAIAAGANRASGVSFTVEEDARLRREALVSAIKDAEAKARVMADALGVKLGKVKAVSESGGGYPRPLMMGAAKLEAAPTPILPGEIEVTANVTIVYSIL